MPTRYRSRKRNKSSPLVEASPKKTKQYNSPRQEQPELDVNSISINKISEGDSTSESESDGASQSLLKTSATNNTANNTAATVSASVAESLANTVTSTSASASASVSPVSSVNTTLSATMLSPDHTQPNQPDYSTPLNAGDSIQDSMQASQNAAHAHFMNPMLFGTPVNIPNMPNMMAFQGPSQPAMSGLSEQDIIRVAVLVKQMLHQEISEIVTIKVDSATLSLKSELKEVRDKCKVLEDEVKMLKVKQDDAKQYSRRMCLRISGLPETEAEDVPKLVLDFANKININIAPEDIDRAHRVGRPNLNAPSDRNRQDETSVSGSRRDREIIIKFTNSSARIRLLRGRAKLREDRIKNVFINEDLTPGRKMLAYECRKIQRINNSKIKKTWVYAGYPHILDDSGKKLKITCISDLDEYQVGNVTPQPMNS